MPGAWAGRASPRPGTCGSCRRSRAARGSRTAGSPCPRVPPPAGRSSQARTRSRPRRPWRWAWALLRGHGRAGVGALARAIGVDALLHLVAEVAEEALDRPGGRVAEAADRVALHLAGDVEQQVDLGHLGL